MQVTESVSLPFFPWSLTSPADALQAASVPATSLAKQRNAALDRLFYDVGNLTAAETDMLLRETNREGAILIVWPSGARGEEGVTKFADYAALRASPGATLSRFAIAGVGSSDLGAAAFARTLADRYGQPVGAIIAGYGVSDLLSEALGGWFVLGGANRLMKSYHDSLGSKETLQESLRAHPAKIEGEAAGQAAEAVVGSNDSETLLRLLLDEDREIASLAGHSKGCLSIAFALEALALSRNAEALRKARKTRVTTVGAVVALPSGFTNVGQYIGAIDWFGALNSRGSVAHEMVPMAWHHLNTTLPYHLDFAEVLKGEPD